MLDIFKPQQNLALIKSKDILGTISMIDFANQEVAVIDMDGTLHYGKMDDIQEFEYLGDMLGVPVFDKDIFVLTFPEDEDVEDNVVLLTKKGNEIRLNLLDEDLEAVEGMESLGLTNIEDVIKEADGTGLKWKIHVLGNSIVLKKEIELEKEKEQNFNIKIFKDVQGKFFPKDTFLYAGKLDGCIDLIKVVFIGASLIEEAYDRTTVTHETFFSSVKNGVLEEQTPEDLFMAFRSKLSK